MTGQTIYAYVGGNPLSAIDPTGLVPNPLELACAAGPNPVCIVGVGADIGSWWLGGAVAIGGSAVYIAATKQDAPDRDTPYGGETPADKPENFRPGSGEERGDLINNNDGSIWSPDRDKHGGSHWKRWPNKRDKKNKRNRESVRPDGSCR